MKSSYELAMERLNKTAPTKKLTAAQRKDLAEIDSFYAAKIAECELSFAAQLEKAGASGDFSAIEELRARLKSDIESLRSKAEAKKEAIRNR